MVRSDFGGTLEECPMWSFDGSSTGQAEAVRLALSRALCELNEENRSILKPEGLLTRDPRMVERKKFGQNKTRKKFQFSKRSYIFIKPVIVVHDRPTVRI